jgi:prephenate dehydrogenase
MSEALVDTIAIIGVGLIGGSIGMAAKARGLAKRVIGIGRSVEKLNRAQQLAAVDIFTTDLRAGVLNADMVFICTPVLAVTPIIRAISGAVKEGAIVTDVGSTKSEITRNAEEILPEGRFFVGGHPMAGLETDGIEAAIPYLFLNSTYVITTTASTHIMALQTMVQFAEGLGSQVMLMSPEDHDRSAAVISHIPHLLSATILRLAAEEQAKGGKVFQLAAGSFRDMTRVALSPPEIWRDVCMSSKEAITSTLKRYEEILAEVRHQIEAEDARAIEKLFSDARDLRSTWVRSETKDEPETEVF